MAEEAGKIYSIEAYALSKMIDHSSWRKILPRGITASDIDINFIGHQHFALDNDGKIIFCELTRGVADWGNIKRGQRWLYESCIKNGPHCAVVCQHAVSIADQRQIDSLHDIQSFQIMIFDSEIVLAKPFFGNDNWQRFVMSWYRDPLRLRRWLLGRTVGRVIPFPEVPF